MKEKIDFEKLYVASRIYHVKVETEMFSQYETFGRVQHTIIASRKKVLIYTKTDEKGIERYYLYPSQEEIKIADYDCSYETQSASGIDAYHQFPDLKWVKSVDPAAMKHMTYYGYLIPAEEYLNVSKDTSLLVMRALLNLINLTKGSDITLSSSEVEAAKQLEKIKYTKKELKKRR